MPKLTKRVVDAYRKPRERDYFVWDEGDGSTKGFGLRIWPSSELPHSRVPS